MLGWDHFNIHAPAHALQDIDTVERGSCRAHERWVVHNARVCSMLYRCTQRTSSSSAEMNQMPLNAQHNQAGFPQRATLWLIAPGADGQRSPRSSPPSLYSHERDFTSASSSDLFRAGSFAVVSHHVFGGASQFVRIAVFLPLSASTFV
jgi:hypothetical protein